MSDLDAQPTDGGFGDLGLLPALVESVTRLGYEEPTPIQVEAIPVLVSGRDLLGMAATGTGKTAAFALPLLHRLGEGAASGSSPRALVLVPTRELATQVAQAVESYAGKLGMKVLAVYGGAPMHTQIRALAKGVDVVVGTPGRVRDHLERGSLALDGVQYAVLDEADEMLDMGFQEDLEAILSASPSTRQTALFSATFPHRLKAIAATHLRDPVRVEIEREQPEPGEAPRVRQVACVVPRVHKRAALGRLLDLEAGDTTLVFCRTRTEVDELADYLDGRGHHTEALHGGMGQAQRDRVMQRLRSGAVDLVVATDVAARGLDVDHLTHVVNYDVPSAPEQYVHRIGRTGRAGREGTAITLVEPRERRLLGNIERLTRQRIEVLAVPTLDEVRAARVTRLRQRVLDQVAEGIDPTWREAVTTMTEEHDLLDVTAAALQVLSTVAWNALPAEDDLPQLAPPPAAAARPPRGGPRQGSDAPPAWARLYVGLGRRDNLRPGDLFGAIVGETGLERNAIGAIRITERFSLVDVPEDAADLVVTTLGRLRWNGRKVVARRDRGTPSDGSDDR
ncbi:MAG: DEAD/DEAH box helicase [Alphaproteobacteria bacterium]|nr:DEAD/DEAH box helicase [Alphaproteobacteria bacterium]